MRRSCSSDNRPGCSPWNNPRICPQLPAFAAAAFAPEPVYSAKYRTREEVRPRRGRFRENNLSKNPVNLSVFIQFYRNLETSSNVQRSKNSHNQLKLFEIDGFSSSLQNPSCATCNQAESGLVTTPADHGGRAPVKVRSCRSAGP